MGYPTNSDEEKVFDCLCIGTSLIISLEAIHQRKLGKDVLMVDSSNSFGGAWKTIEIDGIKDVENAIHYFTPNEKGISFLKRKLKWPIEKSKGKFQYFKKLASKDDTVLLKNNNLHIYFKKKKIKINLIDTGLNTLTGGRVKKVSKFIKSENFLLTYGDGLSNVDLSKLKKIHIINRSTITISIVNPKSKYGRVKIGTKNKILKFEEKPILKNEWINGGFMICSKKIFKYIKNTQSILEKDVFNKILKLNKLFYYKHVGFWQCMDTARDKSEIEKILR